VHVDIGTGDGAFVLRTARANPKTLVIGIDANAEGMRERSHRAAAKPARGGTPNAVFVHASVEALPDELEGLATRVTILFPWGSLLRAVWTGEMAAIERLARPGASIEAVVAISPRDRTAFEGLPSEPAWGSIEAVDPSGYETTWARKLSFDPARRFLRLRAER